MGKVSAARIRQRQSVAQWNTARVNKVTAAASRRDIQCSDLGLFVMNAKQGGML